MFRQWNRLPEKVTITCSFLIRPAFAEPIKAVRIDSTSRFVLTTGDRVVRVWHNVPGFRAAVADLEAKLRRAGNATLRQRIQQQLDDAQRQLDRFQ